MQYVPIAVQSSAIWDANGASLLEVEAMLLKPVKRNEESSYERKLKTLLHQCRLLPTRATQLRAEVNDWVSCTVQGVSHQMKYKKTMSVCF